MMQNFKYSMRSSSNSSESSNQQNQINRLKSPLSSEYEYLGRLVTRERPSIRKSKSTNKNRFFHHSEHNYTIGSQYKGVHDDNLRSSSEDDASSPGKPLGIIRINDRHLREIYRLPTPPPKVKRVYHRLRSPSPKIIERVFVRRPPPQIIENVIEVPPEKVRIINREKYLGKSKPITRSKLVHVNSHGSNQQDEEMEVEDHIQQQYEREKPKLNSVQVCSKKNGCETRFIPMNEYPQQQPNQFMPVQQFSQTATGVSSTAAQSNSTATKNALVYPPQENLRTVGYIESTIPPHIMFASQKPIQLPMTPNVSQQITQPTQYSYPTQSNMAQHQTTPTPYNFPVARPQYQQVIPQPTYSYIPH